jgi:hypothetical protein
VSRHRYTAAFGTAFPPPPIGGTGLYFTVLPLALQAPVTNFFDRAAVDGGRFNKSFPICRTIEAFKQGFSWVGLWASWVSALPDLS